MATTSGTAALASRVASAHLGEAERSALELHERDGAGYAEVAERLGVEPREVAVLLTSARLRVREAVRGMPVPPAESPDCVRARPLLSARQDGEAVAAQERAWLREHVDGCQTCRATRVALREGTLALRAALDAPFVASVAAAPVVAPVVEPVPAAEVAPAPVAAPAPRRPPAPRTAPPRARRRRTPAVLAAGVLAVFIGVLGSILIRGHDQPTSAAERRGAAPTATAAPAKRAATARKTSAAKRPKARRKATAASKSSTPKHKPSPAVHVRKPAVRVAVPVVTAAPVVKKKAATKPKRTPAGAGGQQETRAGKHGAGLPQQPGAPGATATPVPDSCDSESPDCQSG